MPRPTRLLTASTILLAAAMAVVPAAGARAAGAADIHIYAGGGNGDGSLATQALVNATGVIEAAGGDIYIQTPTSIRVIDHATGVISTVAGSQSLDPSAGTISMLGTGSDGSLYVGTTTGSGNTWSTTVDELVNNDGTLHAVTGSPFPSRYVAVAPDGDIYSDGNAGNGHANELLMTPSGASTPQVVAGDATAGHSGSSGTATSAEIYPVTAISVAPSGLPYFADHGDLQYIDGSGDLQTAGGDDSVGGIQSGDGGQATAVALNPISISVNAAGVVYFDNQTSGDLATREIDTSGVLHTAVDGVNAIPAQQIAAESSDVLVAANSTVDSFAADGSQEDGTGTLVAGAPAGSSSPDGTVATSDFLGTTGTPVFDASRGLVFSSNGLIRDVASGDLTTIAGGGDPGDGYGDDGTALQAATHATDLAEATGASTIYFNDVRPLNDADGDDDCRVRDLAGGEVHLVAGGGDDTIPATAAVSATSVQLPCPAPAGLAVSDDGNTVYYADNGDDEGQNSIYAISGGKIRTIVGGGFVELGVATPSAPAIDAELFGVDGLAVSPSGDLYVADSEGVVQISGTTATRILDWPTTVGPIAVGPDGSVYFESTLVSDSEVYRLVKTGATLTVVGGGSDTADGTAVLDADIGPGALAVNRNPGSPSGELALTSEDGVSGDLITADPYSPTAVAGPNGFTASAAPRAVTLTMTTPPAGESIEIVASQSSQAPSWVYDGTDIENVPHSSSATTSVVVQGIGGQAVTPGFTYSFSAFTELDNPGGSDTALQTSAPATVTATAPPPPAAPAVTTLSLVAGTATAHVAWHDPAGGLPSADHTEVREITGHKAPASASTGKLVYSGRGTSYTATKLAAHQDYTFCVTNTGSLSPTSPMHCITATGTTVKVTAPSRVKKHSVATIKATLSNYLGAVAKQRLSLQVASHGSWKALTHKTTTKKGSVTFAVRISATAAYRVVFLGAAHDLGATSKSVTIRART